MSKHPKKPPDHMADALRHAPMFSSETYSKQLIEKLYEQTSTTKLMHGRNYDEAAITAGKIHIGPAIEKTTTAAGLAELQRYAAAMIEKAAEAIDEDTCKVYSAEYARTLKAMDIYRTASNPDEQMAAFRERAAMEAQKWEDGAKQMEKESGGKKKKTIMEESEAPPEAIDFDF